MLLTQSAPSSKKMVCNIFYCRIHHTASQCYHCDSKQYSTWKWKMYLKWNFCVFLSFYHIARTRKNFYTVDKKFPTSMFNAWALILSSINIEIILAILNFLWNLDILHENILTFTEIFVQHDLGILYTFIREIDIYTTLCFYDSIQNTDTSSKRNWAYKRVWIQMEPWNDMQNQKLIIVW